MHCKQQLLDSSMLQPAASVNEQAAVFTIHDLCSLRIDKQTHHIHSMQLQWYSHMCAAAASAAQILCQAAVAESAGHIQTVDAEGLPSHYPSYPLDAAVSQHLPQAVIKCLCSVANDLINVPSASQQVPAAAGRTNDTQQYLSSAMIQCHTQQLHCIEQAAVAANALLQELQPEQCQQVLSSVQAWCSCQQVCGLLAAISNSLSHSQTGGCSRALAVLLATLMSSETPAGILLTDTAGELARRALACIVMRRAPNHHTRTAM